MGSKAGYEYRWQFSMVGIDEINSRFKSVQEEYLSKAFIFEFRSAFTTRTRDNSSPHQEAADSRSITMDSESFDAMTLDWGDRLKEVVTLLLRTGRRLEDYWMTKDEILLMLGEAIDFARRIDTENAALDKIPVVVRLEVCTAQQDGETVEAMMVRAIRAQHLVPLYLWFPQTPEKYKVARYGDRWIYFLAHEIGKTRVENMDEGLRLMQSCPICSRSPTIGAQISVLPICGHAFHSSCICVWLEMNDKCPSCKHPAYGRI